MPVWNICLNLLQKNIFNNILLSKKTRSVSNVINVVLRFVTILLCDFFLMLKERLYYKFLLIKSRNILFKNNFYDLKKLSQKNPLPSEQKDETNLIFIKGGKPSCKSCISILLQIYVA